MSLQTAIAHINAAASSAMDTVAADVTKVERAKASLLATIQSEIGAEAVGIATFFQREDARAAAWERRHLNLLTLVAVGGWLVAGVAAFLRIHG